MSGKRREFPLSAFCVYCQLVKYPERDLAEFCRRWKVRELSLFGSVLRDDFGRPVTWMCSSPSTMMHVSKEFQDVHPDIPWRPIQAQRHVLAHEYGEIKHDRLWRVAVVHIPALIGMPTPLVPELPQGTDEPPTQT